MIPLVSLLVACVHTPPHEAVPGAPTVAFARREQMTRDGAWCAWEAESLSFDGRPLWVADAPGEESWCRAPGGEASRVVDVLGRDGPFLSVRLTEWGCCPDHAVSRCVTLDVRTGEPTTLEAYDPRHAERRWSRAVRDAPPGFTLSPDAFLVGDRHVRFCAMRGEEMAEVPVR